MKLSELIKAKEEAEAVSVQAKADREQARQALAKAVTDDELADAMVEQAHTAIRDLLTERGHHSIQGSDGTFTVYHATDKSDKGWACYQPVPGDVD